MEYTVRVALWIIVVALSLIPWAIAYKRKCKNFVVIDALSFFFSWIIIGWIVAMVWAIRGEADSEEFSKQLRGF